MAEFCIQKGNSIFGAGTKLNFLAVIIEGSISMELPGTTITLTTGDVIGLLDIIHHVHSFNYVALEDTIIDSISSTNMTNLAQNLRDSSETANVLFSGFCRQFRILLQAYGKKRRECNELFTYLHNNYENYTKLCAKASVSPKELPGLNDVSHLALEDSLEEWHNLYYSDLQNLFQSDEEIPYTKYPAFFAGILMQGSKDFQTLISNLRIMDDYLNDLAAVLITDNSTDFFDLYAALIMSVAKDGSDTRIYTAVLYSMLQYIKTISCVENSLYEKRLRDYQKLLEKLQMLALKAKTVAEEKEQVFSSNLLTDSLDTILDYSQCSEETAIQFKRAIKAYKALPDRASTADDILKLRRQITKMFYEIYQAAFLVSTTDENVPPILKMFFNFGYVDEDLAGYENAMYLYTISKTFEGNPSLHVYTIWEWLMLIYNGQKEPRKNEFDLDFPAYIADLQRSGKLSSAEAKEALDDNKQKLLFELSNMFPTTNKITYGRISTFCPVFSEHNVIKPLEDCLTTAETVFSEIENICKIDFSAFCRPALYANNQLGISREYIETEFLPDVILLPNVGTRGVMWQEIEGKNRLSPATFLLPVFSMENLSLLLIRMTAEFRWELCRRIQGTRWNDVTEHSLTGNYYDYLQFFKKNNDLSPDMKEKCSVQLKKCKNNFKEYFIMDYIYWILYEGKGSPKLNRIARAILMDYCPFPKEIRETLQANPMYEGIIRKWELAHNKELKRFDSILLRCTKANIPVPDELMTQKAFLDS